MEKMPWIVSSQDVDALALQSYSRKEKSLGVLVSNFVRIYNRDDVDLFGIDEAAAKLGVERRRIYDVVNILESIEVVSRKGKNLYSWNGFLHIPRSLHQLKEEGLREGFGTSSICSNSDKVSHDDESEESFSLTPDDQDNSSLSKLDHKKESSLWLLSQNFVKMFLCSHDDLITLDSAAKALLSDSQDPMHMRTASKKNNINNAGTSNSGRLQDLEALSSAYKPQYCNQDVTGLLGHYTEAWNKWFAELDRK
ncbi:hypothetical protein Bca101_102310 [Brassica carinata]